MFNLLVEYEVIKNIIYKSVDDSIDRKCRRKYDISSGNLASLKSSVNGFIKTIKENNTKTHDLLGSIKDNFKILDNASKEYNTIIDNDDSEKFDKLRSDWEEKYPDIPFGTDVPSYNEQVQASKKAIDEYIKKSNENEKLLKKYSGDWIKDLDTTNNYQDSREYEKKFSSFLKGWKKEVTDHLAVIRSLPTFKSFDWNQKRKKEYIKSCEDLISNLDELDKLVFHKVD